MIKIERNNNFSEAFINSKLMIIELQVRSLPKVGPHLG
jgi:hypothetical protein